MMNVLVVLCDSTEKKRGHFHEVQIKDKGTIKHSITDFRDIKVTLNSLKIKNTQIQSLRK